MINHEWVMLHIKAIVKFDGRLWWGRFTNSLWGGTSESAGWIEGNFMLMYLNYAHMYIEISCYFLSYSINIITKHKDCQWFNNIDVSFQRIYIFKYLTFKLNTWSPTKISGFYWFSSLIKHLFMCYRTVSIWWIIIFFIFKN